MERRVAFLMLAVGAGVLFFMNIRLYNYNVAQHEMEQSMTDKDTEISSLLNQLRVQMEKDNQNLRAVNQLQKKEENLKRENQKLQGQIEGLKSDAESVKVAINDTNTSGDSPAGGGGDVDVATPVSPKSKDKASAKTGSGDNVGSPDHAQQGDTQADLKGDIKAIDDIDLAEPTDVPDGIIPAPVGIAVVVMCFNRPKFLDQTLQRLFELKPAVGFPVFISQDGDDKDVEAIINKYLEKQKDENAGQTFHLRYDYYNDKPREKVDGLNKDEWEPYYRISGHYEWMFNQLFSEYSYQRVLVLEDDMEIGVDFFNYFDSLAPLLDEDPTIYCISAWNDNGQDRFVSDSQQSRESLWRTDVFPGLGWMMSRELWIELKNKWPSGFWDDWIRETEQRKDRTCIRPEINRVYTFGEHGSSQGQFFKEYLKPIKLNRNPEDAVDFSELDLSYLLQKNYDPYLEGLVGNATVVPFHQIQALPAEEEPKDYRVYYSNLKDFTNKGKRLKLMTDHKAGLPRTSYNGVVTFRWNNNRIFFTPKN